MTQSSVISDGAERSRRFGPATILAGVLSVSLVLVNGAVLWVVVIAALFLWVVIDGRTQRRRIADLEARGVRRRSQRPVPTAEEGR